MQIPVEITFRDIERSDSVEAKIRDWVGKLDRIFDRIVRCEVVVGDPHRHHHKGHQFYVRVRLTVPGTEIVVSHSPGDDGAHEDIYVAVRDAFQATKRQLEDYVRKSLHRGDIKREGSGASHGRVTFLDVQKDWGFIEPDDGRRIYFHRNSVLGGGMDNVEVGDEVRFTEEQGNEGPQASSVDRIGAHGRHLVNEPAELRSAGDRR